MASTVVFDLDKVLLGGDASTLFLHGRLRQAPGRLLLLLLAAPLLVPGAMLPQLRPLAARVMTRIAVGGRRESDVEAVASAFGEALTRKPEAAVADAIACVREHQRTGDVVVVATGCEETLARGFLAAIGLGDLDVVGSTGALWPPRVRRAMGEVKVALLTERGYPPPWPAAYSDSPSDLPLFAGTPRPVLVNADEKAARQVERTLGRRPETRTWR
ncbi:HAD family hydrolase [Blastococcus sp. CT_GayMR16]|uniref:HAD family hydrolase n=1 Tax=Blastococcus sp. CT_GayMR16 TaxID=2559607 RepID=UPI001073E807|nr:HAD family hydrolase [Blastococcus sp. CT_GayMR16]TFV91354.1 haloacid dehalogenase-like hydrolase [Blastococcus sp. CT_GayMR16]